MIPSNDHLGSSSLLQEVQHLCLEDWIDGFHGDSSSTLGHGKDIGDTDGVVIDELSKHETHNFHGDSRTGMAEHLEESEGRDVDGFGGVRMVVLVRRRSTLLIQLKYCYQ